MIQVQSDDGSLEWSYTDGERNAIIAAFPRDIRPSVGMFRPDLIALRDIEWAARNYIFAFSIAPSVYDIDFYREQAEKRLSAIHLTVGTARDLGQNDLADRIDRLSRSVSGGAKWWQSMRDPRGNLHRNVFIRKVFDSWAFLKECQLSDCRFSAVVGSPMLTFVQRAVEPATEVTGEAIEAEMLKLLLKEAKQTTKIG
jgi:hypothetical protein